MRYRTNASGFYVGGNTGVIVETPGQSLLAVTAQRLDVVLASLDYD